MHTGRVTGDRGWAALDGRDNALNAIRLCLALAVVFGHSYVLGYGQQPPLPGIHERAVDGFFVVSGFLIAGSRERQPFGSFLWRRGLRIFPGLWACLIVTAFLLAPLAASVTGGSWKPTAAVRFVTDNLTTLIGQWGIGETLAEAPYPGVWNGSLWTLAYEFGCYLGLAALFAVTRRRIFAVSAVLASAALLTVVAPPALELFVVGQSVRLTGFFAAGSLVYLLRGRLPATGRTAAAAGLAVVILYLMGERAFCAFAPLPLAYSLLFLGSVWRTGVGRRNDISYGMYVYAFPVQQCLVVLGLSTTPVAVFVAMSVAVTSAFAWGSWLLVERPAMRLRQPTRRTSRATLARAETPRSARVSRAS